VTEPREEGDPRRGTASAEAFGAGTAPDDGSVVSRAVTRDRVVVVAAVPGSGHTPSR